MKRTILLFLFLIKGPMPGFACDCDGSVPFVEAFHASNSIFLGQVVSINPYSEKSGQGLPTELTVEIEVRQVYKGRRVKRIRVRTAVDIASCGYPFKKGELYLVYTFKDRNVEYVSYCDRTAGVADAREDIDKLAKYITVKQDGL